MAKISSNALPSFLLIKCKKKKKITDTINTLILKIILNTFNKKKKVIDFFDKLYISYQISTKIVTELINYIYIYIYFWWMKDKISTLT